MPVRLAAVLIALVGLLVASCAVRAPISDVFVEVRRADLDTALAAALAQNPEVNFPERIRFDTLRFRHVAGLGIEGRARFFDPATGRYPPPIVRFFGSVPGGWWRVRDGALTVNLASVDGAEPTPGGADPTSVAADVQRDVLGTAVGQILARMSFPAGVDPTRRWTIESGTSHDDFLRFELRSR